MYLCLLCINRKFIRGYANEPLKYIRCMLNLPSPPSCVTESPWRNFCCCGLRFHIWAAPRQHLSQDVGPLEAIMLLTFEVTQLHRMILNFVVWRYIITWKLWYSEYSMSCAVNFHETELSYSSHCMSAV